MLIKTVLNQIERFKGRLPSNNREMTEKVFGKHCQKNVLIVFLTKLLNRVWIPLIMI